MDRRFTTLSSVMHILGLVINFMSIRKMDYARVKTMYEKEIYNMVRGEMVLYKGF
jgi:hypothetical protein